MNSSASNKAVASTDCSLCSVVDETLVLAIVGGTVLDTPKCLDGGGMRCESDG